MHNSKKCQYDCVSVLNSEPMDTGTDEGDDDKVKINNYGVKLPPTPAGKCPPRLQVCPPIPFSF